MIRIPFDFGHGIVLSLIVITPTNSNAMLFFCLFCFGFCVPRWLVVTSLMTPLFRFAFMSAWLLSSSFWAWPLMRQHREPTQLWLDSCFYTWTTTCLAEYWFSLSHHHALCRAWIYYVYRQLNWLFFISRAPCPSWLHDTFGSHITHITMVTTMGILKVDWFGSCVACVHSYYCGLGCTLLCCVVCVMINRCLARHVIKYSSSLFWSLDARPIATKSIPRLMFDAVMC